MVARRESHWRRALSEAISTTRAEAGTRTGWFATGGIVGALLASSCCIAPLVLVMLGISGAWIGNLTALEPFQPYFAGIALIFIGLGFWHVYFRSLADCTERTSCARPRSSMLVKAVLWLATFLVIGALTTSWWAPYFY